MTSSPLSKEPVSWNEKHDPKVRKIRWWIIEMWIRKVQTIHNSWNHLLFDRHSFSRNSDAVCFFYRKSWKLLKTLGYIFFNFNWRIPVRKADGIRILQSTIVKNDIWYIITFMKLSHLYGIGLGCLLGYRIICRLFKNKQNPSVWKVDECFQSYLC